MELEIANSIFTEDDKGIIVITDISEDEDVTYAEFVYDGKNAGIYNRSNKKYYVLQNIPPVIRDRLAKSEEITIIEKDAEEGIASYSVKVRLIENMGIPDKWDEYAQNLMNDLKKVLTKEEFDQLTKSQK